MVLMEAYAVAEVGAYLILKAWNGQGEKKGLGWADNSAQWGSEGRGKRMTESGDQKSWEWETRETGQFSLSPW